MAGRIAVVGSSMVDLVTYVTRLPERGETLEAPDFKIGCGGKGANQAVAAAKLGADVMMVARVGDDVFADNTLANFRQFGVDTTHVEKVPGTPSGVATITVDPSGENSILIIKGANNRLLPAEIDRAAADLKACSLILLQLEVPLETVYRVLDFAAAEGIETILNPAPATALDPDRVAKATFLVPNQTELALLTGRPVADEAQAIDAARTLIARGVRTVIVTLGARGALMVTADQVEHIAPVKVTPVDTTGAGDAFIAAFARYYVESRNVLPALRLAAVYAADSITRPGTQGAYATAAEFEAFRARLGA